MLGQLLRGREQRELSIEVAIPTSPFDFQSAALVDNESKSR